MHSRTIVACALASGVWTIAAVEACAPSSAAPLPRRAPAASTTPPKAHLDQRAADASSASPPVPFDLVWRAGDPLRFEETCNTTIKIGRSEREVLVCEYPDLPPYPAPGEPSSSGPDREWWIMWKRLRVRDDAHLRTILEVPTRSVAMDWPREAGEPDDFELVIAEDGLTAVLREVHSAHEGGGERELLCSRKRPPRRETGHEARSEAGRQRACRALGRYMWRAGAFVHDDTPP